MAALGPRLSNTKLIVVANREPYIHVKRTAAPRRRGLLGWFTGRKRTDEPVVDSPGQRAGHGPRPRDAGVRRHVDRAWQRQRRPRGLRRRRGGCRSRPTTRPTRCAASGSRQEEEEGYYYGLANNALWPLCHIAYARPGVRPARMAAVQARQPALRQHGHRRDRQRARHRVRPGLPLRAAAAPGEGGAARHHRLPVLAHPVAEQRGVPHLPVERGDRATACSATTCSASTSSTTATTSSTRSTPASRRGSTASTSPSSGAATGPT